jgi:ribulose-5-phosphate 4-epimerase/fuculose-1-phosphate aldolase
MPDISATRIDAVTEAKIHLAAALRLAVLHELEEGIDNHFTVTVPGRVGQYLILPFGKHWSEARASDMMVFDEQGNTLEGERLFFEAMMRVLDRELPGYRD